MTMQKILNVPGKKDKMVSQKLQDLSESDLNYLEILVGAEMGRNQTDQKRLLRLLNAIAAQKKLVKINKW